MGVAETATAAASLEGFIMIEYKKTSDAMHESSEEYRLLVENANEAILVAQDSVFVFSNSKAESLFGYSRAEIESQRLTDFVYEADRKIVREQPERMLRGEPLPDVYSFRIQSKSGEIKWVDLKLTLFQWKNRPAVLCFMTDITERKRVEMALVSSENKLRNILVNTPQIIISLDSQGKIVFVNTHFLKLTGWKEQNVIGQNWFDLFIPENIREVIREVFSVTMQQRETSEYSYYENEIETKSGELRYIAWSNVCSLDAKGMVADVTCLGIDLTERKLAEDALRESEERFRMLFKHHSAVMLVIDRETGKIIDANEASENFYGWSIDELKRKCIQQIYVPSSDAVKNQMEKAAISHSARFEFRHRRADGSIRDVEVFNNEIEIAGKNLLYSIVHDITERHLAEESVLDSEKRFRAAFMGSPAALAITTQDGGIWIDANQTELAMFGYTRDELIGKSVMDTNLWIDLNDRNRIIAALVQNGEVRNQNVQLRHKDGKSISASVSANSLTLKGVKHILFATEDITERQQSEERIKQNLIEKEILLREIHHRVKNNLAVISSLLGLQANRIQGNAVKEMMDACQLRIKSMALVHEKMYCNQNVSRVDFSDYINSIVQDLTSTYHNEIRNITIRIQIQDILLDIETATPCGMIINELISNAMKHAFPETIRPELTISFEKADNTYTLMVQDNGIGLSDDFGSTSTNTLGLLLVRALSRQLRGTVKFHSDASVRQGTTVTFTFNGKEGKMHPLCPAENPC
jgi:PAS domain S-box-containing protein